MTGPGKPRAASRRLFLALTLPCLLAVVVSVLGLGLRVEHALTFDGPGRGSDYAVYVQGVRWILEHKRPFDFDPSVNYQVRYQPPLWYALGAVVLAIFKSERAIAGLSVIGWIVRQGILARILREAAPKRPWSHLVALSFHAFLPLSILIDGKVMPEGPTATLFTVGAYFLWRLERELSRTGQMSLRTAGLFGFFAGVGILMKATASVLLIGAVLVLLVRGLHDARANGVRSALRTIGRPAALAGLVFALTAGWYVGPNVKKYGHPFPHAWDREGPEQHPVLAQPLLYRRPLGWALPLQWREYLRFPVIGGSETPNPNFWAYVVIGSYSDLYNRGFCRLKGGGLTDKVWGGNGGFMASGPQWSVSGRCMRLFSRLAWLGLAPALLAAIAVFWAAIRNVRSTYREASLALPLLATLVIGFILLFALRYPFDHMAVLNPRYVLAASTPIAACIGMMLVRLRRGSRSWLAAHGLCLAWGTAIAMLVMWERFGRLGKRVVDLPVRRVDVGEKDQDLAKCHSRSDQEHPGFGPLQVARKLQTGKHPCAPAFPFCSCSPSGSSPPSRRTSSHRTRRARAPARPSHPTAPTRRSCRRMRSRPTR